MALAKGKVQAKPDLACVGRVTEVGDAYLSKKEVYHVIPVKVEASAAGQNGTFFFLFRPEWFGKDFNPESIKQTVYEGKDDAGNPVEVDGEKAFGIYRRYIADEARRSVLESLATTEAKPQGFEALGQAFDSVKGKIDAAVVTNILREELLGNEVGWVSTQRTEEDGSLSEQYNISYFFPLLEDDVNKVLKSKDSKRRKRPLVITWDE